MTCRVISMAKRGFPRRYFIAFLGSPTIRRRAPWLLVLNSMKPLGPTIGLDPGLDRRRISASFKLLVHVRLEAPELLLEGGGELLERFVRRQAHVLDVDT